MKYLMKKLLRAIEYILDNYGSGIMVLVALAMLSFSMYASISYQSDSRVKSTCLLKNTIEQCKELSYE